MTIYYIDPEATGANTGETPDNDAFQNISDATIGNGHSYYFKCDTTHPNLSGRVAMFDNNTIIIGDYYGRAQRP